MFTRMDKREVWKSRVEEWQASGLGLADYCRGKEFTPSGLRYWIKRLGPAEVPATQAKPVRLARVVRAARKERPVPEPSPTPAAERFVVEAGSMRVQVPADLEPARLEAVLIAIGRASTRGAS